MVTSIRGYFSNRRTAVAADTGWKEYLLAQPRKWFPASLLREDPIVKPNEVTELPKLPVPPLQQTLETYLKFLGPIVNPAQLERTKGLLKDFGTPTGVGPILQERLVTRREQQDNWAYEYWMNDMYMDVRLPLPINSNPGMVLPPRKFKTIHDVARFAAWLIDGVIEHKEMLDRGELQQERALSREKGQPLCMAQYYRLLGGCRVPGPRDSQLIPTVGIKEVEHVIVACRNQFYCVPVKASDRGRLSVGEISSQLLYILSDAPCLLQTAVPVGLLTAQNRDHWAADRELLLQADGRNRRNLELIEQSLFLLCFDEPLSNSFYVKGEHELCNDTDLRCDETNMLHQMIHGGGSHNNSANRFFDKTLQLVISTDGALGLCYEHSMSEGGPVVQLVEGMVKRAETMESTVGSTDEGHTYLPNPEKLDWVITSTMEKSIQRATNYMDRAVDDLDLVVYRFNEYGKEFIKSCNTSPDVYIQLALQLAYYKLYGHLVSTYESASTRRFLHGRVDCIRSASPDAAEWTSAMCQGEGQDGVTMDDGPELSGKRVTFSLFSENTKRELFKAATDFQTKTMVDNILGQGIDIHLLGLREQSRSQSKRGALSELFNDESFKIANCFLLSTSQVATNLDSFMGYGPVTKGGYGASYNPKANEIVFCISAFKSDGTTSATKFARSLAEALGSMKDLLHKTN